MEDIRTVKPIDEKVFEFKQSKYVNVPKVPFRSIILGPSGSGKSILLVSLILDISRDVFERVYVLSPSVNHDSIWEPVKKHVDTEKGAAFIEDYNSSDSLKIIDTQRRVTRFMKEHKQKKLHNILIILDDIAGSPEIARHNKLLQSLYVRGRHAGISVITASQKSFILHPVYHMPKKPIDYQCTHFDKVVRRDLNTSGYYVGHTANSKTRRQHHRKTCYNENDRVHHNIYLYQFMR